MPPVKREASDNSSSWNQAPLSKKAKRAEKRRAKKLARPPAPRDIRITPAFVSLECKILPQRVAYRRGRFICNYKKVHTFTDLIRLHADNLEHYFARALAYNPEHAERQTGYSKSKWNSLLDALAAAGFTSDSLKKLVEYKKPQPGPSSQTKAQKREWNRHLRRSRTESLEMLRELLRTFDPALLTLEAKPDDVDDSNPNQAANDWASDEEESDGNESDEEATNEWAVKEEIEDGDEDEPNEWAVKEEPADVDEEALSERAIKEEPGEEAVNSRNANAPTKRNIKQERV